LSEVVGVKGDVKKRSIKFIKLKEDTQKCFIKFIWRRNKMKKLECIIFDVEHGFCAFIKSPNDYGLLYDIGGRQCFSPAKYIRKEYCQSLVHYNKRRIPKLIVSHLHGDHFSDVGSLEGYEKPKTLLRDKETLKFLESKIKTAKSGDIGVETLRKFRKFQASYTKDPEEAPDWGFDYFKSKQISYDNAEDASSSDDKIINNRSYITVIRYAGKSILFPGDIEAEGWNKFLENKTLKSHVSNINFFVASHHGHETGFTSDILESTGKPDLYIVSAKSGDEHVDSEYSKKENSNGFMVNGRDKLSKMISTRECNKSIKISIYENGTTDVRFIDTPDNLNQNQVKLRDRKTVRAIKKW